MRFRPLLFLIPLLLVPLALGGTVSYRSLTAKDAEADFYRDGGRRHYRQRVHLHAPAARIHADPTLVRTRNGTRLLVFKNRSVPLVVDRDSVYLRKILQRTRSGDRVCLKGTVLRHPDGGAGRYALFVHTLKKAP